MSASAIPSSPPAGIHSTATVSNVQSGNPIQTPLTPITQR